MPSTELILAGNGPGELAGWIRPVARAARAVATQTHRALRLTLALSPSQYASGREPEVIQRWGLFDRILDPARCVRLALGLGTLPIARRSALIHLGGDLWVSARLARRLRIPACALAETTIIAHRHRPFARVFATSEALAERLVSEGVPREKILVSGDPRTDVFEDADRRLFHTPYRPSVDGQYTLAMLPGSRDQFFRFLTPYFLDIASVLGTIHPKTTFQIIVSPFVSPHLVEQARDTVARSWPHLRVMWVLDEMWTALAHSDLALTIPGTNTLELAMAGVPFAVILPTHQVERIPVEGVLEWVARLPGLARVIKRGILSRHLATRRFVALPNVRAGKLLVPEWVGRWTPTEVANRLAELLLDHQGRASMATTLSSLYGGTPGASTTLATQALALAEALPEAPQ